MKRILLTRGQSTVVDDIDYNYLKQFKWNLGKNGYANRGIWSEGKTTPVSMHVEIFARMGQQLPKKYSIDHKNLNKLDNRRYNLRAASPQQQMAHKPPNKNNKLQLKGVWKVGKFFRAAIMVMYKSIHLGYYQTAKEAAKAYNAAAIKYFDEFAWLNPID